MFTECNCDMPIWAYADWLRDQGWSIEELEMEFISLYDNYNERVEYLGCPVTQQTSQVYGDGDSYNDSNPVGRGDGINYGYRSESESIYYGYGINYDDEEIEKGFQITDRWQDENED